MNEEKRICIGRFSGAYGVKGLGRLQSFTQEPASIFHYSPLTDEAGERIFTLTNEGQGDGFFVVAVKGFSTREEVESLNGIRLYIARANLPEPEDENTYYFADLIGLDVRTPKGLSIGIIENVYDFGAGTILEIKPEQGAGFMLPFKDAYVPEVDLEQRFVTIIIPRGWLAEEKQPVGDPS
ncbi:MAG: ribosome maturation factor RimM [Alphaproteobacteria bacterium]|nr:ribosome maturation factor RimM [Alphaproteobacteria bacterium]